MNELGVTFRPLSGRSGRSPEGAPNVLSSHLDSGADYSTRTTPEYMFMPQANFTSPAFEKATGMETGLFKGRPLSILLPPPE